MNKKCCVAMLVIAAVTASLVVGLKLIGSRTPAWTAGSGHQKG